MSRRWILAGSWDFCGGGKILVGGTFARAGEFSGYHVGYKCINYTALLKKKQYASNLFLCPKLKI